MSDYSTSKFAGRLAERMYNVTLNGGADEEASYPDGGGWWGRLNMRRAVVIVHQDSQGFVDADVLTEETANERWSEIEALTADDEESADEPEPSDYIMSDDGGGIAVSNEGKHMGTFDDREAAEEAIRADAKAHSVFPDVWFMSDHGNAHRVEDWRWE
jgi:hypothetical protein